MEEQLFWTIYFASVVDLLPPQAASLRDQPPSALESLSTSASTLNPSFTNLLTNQRKQVMPFKTLAVFS
jgi:hypothetical protein